MFAKHRLEDGYDIGEEDLTFYYVDLLAHRDVSNAIAEDLGILHQSPQLIVIKHGRVVHHSTHESIELHSVKESL